MNARRRNAGYSWAGVHLAYGLACLLPAVMGVSGCGSSNTTNITSITISGPGSVSLNTQADFSAQVTLANSTISTNTAVTWQVNATTGGNSTIGTIVSSTTDTNVGVYTAPTMVPTTNNGQVTITAIISVTPSGSSTSKTITSNSLTVTIGSGAGLAVTPTQATVGAGGSEQFTATLNGVVDTNATWSVSSTNGGVIGSIGATTGLYAAPFSPPPDSEVTVTATDGMQTATATVTVVYSDASLKGPFAFSYTANDASGFRAVAGRFVTDGAGTILSGVEDIDSFGSLVATAVPMLPGSYKVGPDGRTSALINTNHGSETWQFVLTSNEHALMIRFDSAATGSGTIDQQNLNYLSSSDSVISGPYVFGASGGDTQFNPMGIAGKFSANGSGGVSSPAIVDKKDNTTVQTSDTSLSGTYSFDALNSGTGRGTLTLSSTDIGQLEFAFYVIDNTHLDLVEIDQNGYLSGVMYSGVTGSSFTSSILSAANYVFTAGGNSSAGAYAEGGVFTPDGNGNITGGAFDSDNAGTVTANTTLSACTYAVDAATGRVDLKLCGSGSSTLEFATYPTAASTAVMLELDSSAVASGTAYLQQASPAALSGNYGLVLSGQGVFHNAPASYQSNAEGEATITNTAISAANLDINNYGTSPQSNDPLGTGSSLVAPGTNGRGTGVLSATDPPATYNFAYYVVNANMAIVVGQDKTRVQTGTIVLQF